MPKYSQLDASIKLGAVHGRDVGDKFEAQKVESSVSELYRLKIPAAALAYFEGYVAEENLELLRTKGIALVHIESLYVDKSYYDEANQDFSRALVESIRFSSGGFIHGGEVEKKPW